MPLFSFIFTIPRYLIEPGTLRQEVEVTGKQLLSVHVLIPSGHQGLTGLRIRYGAEIVIPQNEAGWLSGDGIYLPIEFRRDLPESPCKFVVEGYNMDMCYEHSFYVFILTSDVRDRTPEEAIAIAIAKMAEAMGLKVI